MSNYNRLLLLTFFLLLGVSCKEDAALPDKGWYMVETLEPEINGNSLLLEANIISTGDESIQEKGFIVERDYNWGNSNEPQRHVDTCLVEGKAFTLKLENDFDKGGGCYIKAYVKTATHLYVGKKCFIQMPEGMAPIIEAVVPAVGRFDTLIILKGKYFSSCKERNKVFVNGIETVIEKASDTEISFRLKEHSDLWINKDKLDIKFQIGNHETILPDAYTLKSIVIRSVSSSVPYAGERVTVTMDNFNLTDRVYLEISSEELITTPLQIKSKGEDNISFILPDITNRVGGEIYLNNETNHTKHRLPITIKQSWIYKDNYTYSDMIYANNFLISGNCGYIYSNNKLFCYNSFDAKWQYFDLPFGIDFPKLIFLLDNDVWINYWNKERNSNYFLCFNTKTEKWREVASSLPELVSYCQSTVAGSEVYFVIYGGNGNNSLVKYIPKEDKWELVKKHTSISNICYADGSLYYSNFHIEKMKIGEWDNIQRVVTISNDDYGLSYTVINNLVFDGLNLFYTVNGFIYKYDVSRKENKALGCLSSNSVMFLFPFVNELLVGNQYGLYQFRDLSNP